MLPAGDDVLYQPRLRWYSHAWRLLLCLLWSVLALISEPDGPVKTGWLLVLDLVLGLVAFVLVLFRRRWPTPIAVILVALSMISLVGSGPAALALVSLSTRRRWLPIAVVGVLNVIAIQITTPSDESLPWWGMLILNVVMTACVIGWGLYIGSRRALVWTLRERAERAEAEKELRAEGARTLERSRIAREMHDVLAHRISQVSMHAGALAYRDDLSAEELRAGAGRIQEMSHQALDDLRGVLGVLRNAEGRPAIAPQPTHADLAELITCARTDGMLVEFADQVEVADQRELPATVGRTVYRIVQEALTNARKHAPGARVSVRLSGDPATGIDLTVGNRLGFGPLPQIPGAGLGLVGLRERVDLAGGTFTSQRTLTEFTLRVWLPWAT